MVAILHNPRYAGAFVFGRTRQVYRAGHKLNAVKVNREDWQVCIQDAHPGYIDWAEFERNQTTLRQNVAAWSQGGRGSVPAKESACCRGA